MEADLGQRARCGAGAALRRCVGAGGSGAAGLSLQVASVAVLLEPSLRPGIEQQAVGRIYRIGQQKPTKCIRLVVTDSVEPNILHGRLVD